MDKTGGRQPFMTAAHCHKQPALQHRVGGCSCCTTMLAPPPAGWGRSWWGHRLQETAFHQQLVPLEGASAPGIAR